MKDQELRQIPLVALFSALGIVFPQVFHLFGLGAPFLPMFIPVMVGSMFLSLRYAMLMSVLTPLISWLLTSMPPVVPPILPVVMAELLLIALVIVLLRKFTRWPVFIIVLIAVIADRFILFVIA
ncbi:MAG: ECF transporter S component, partial [Calditrichales bacterium]